MLFRGSETASSGSATEITVAVPAGTQDGDAMIVCIGTARGTDSINDHGSWTKLQDRPGGTGNQVYWFGRRTASSEPANYTFDGLAAAHDIVAQIVVLNPEGGTLAYDDHSEAFASSGTVSTTTSITGADATSALVCCFTVDASRTVSVAPTGMTQAEFDDPGAYLITSYYELDVGASAESRSITWSSGGTNFAALAVFVSAPGGGGGGGIEILRRRIEE